MAKETLGSVALLPIQPRFANAILNGRKKVEFRKIKFNRLVTHIVIYASSPIKKIIGYFNISRIDEDTPDNLWAKYSKVGSITHDEYQAYYQQKVRGVAICVGRLNELLKPITLKKLDGKLSVPQSFSYLTSEHFRKIKIHAG